MDWIKKNIKEPTLALFHYTTIDGLLGIFKEKNIWATSIFYLNDQAEFSLALNIFKDAIKELKNRLSLPVEPAIRGAGYKRDQRAEFLDQIADLGFYTNDLTSVVFSLSENDDQLSQWRGYCSTDHGFSVGFDYARLKNRMKKEGFILAKCVYDPKEQQGLMARYVKEVVEPNMVDLNEDNFASRFSKTVVALLHILPMLKHASFYEEAEWRLISVRVSGHKSMRFRAGRTTLIPYYEFGLIDDKNTGETLPIKSITIGPTPNKDESWRSIKALLEGHNLSAQVKVVLSEIPYREV